MKREREEEERQPPPAPVKRARTDDPLVTNIRIMTIDSSVRRKLIFD